MKRSIIVMIMVAVSSMLAFAAGPTEESASATGSIDRTATIKILIPYNAFDPKTDNSVKVLREETGFSGLEFEVLPEQNPLDKLNLMFAGGDTGYDYIIIRGDSNGKSVYATYAVNDQLTDLTDRIRDYPNIMNVDERSRSGLLINDRLYALGSTALPYRGDGWGYQSSIRTDWLAAVGLSIPTTRDEFYTVLRAFKDEDPGNLGADNIPFLADARTIVSTIGVTFGIIYDYDDRDGIIVDTRLLPEYRDYLTFMNKLYVEGLMDPDMPINNGQISNEKIGAGRVGYRSKDLLSQRRSPRFGGCDTRCRQFPITAGADPVPGWEFPTPRCLRDGTRAQEIQEGRTA